jgi:hypothetical protein
MPMYNLPDVYSTTSTVPSTANLQVDIVKEGFDHDV